MGIFDAINTSEKAMGVHRYRSEIVAENIANVYTPGYRRQVMELQANSFSGALRSAGGGGAASAGAGGPFGASGGAVSVMGIRRVGGGKDDQRQQALKGVQEMMESKSAFELNLRAASMLKSMALSSLEIGRGG